MKDVLEPTVPVILKVYVPGRTTCLLSNEENSKLPVVGSNLPVDLPSLMVHRSRPVEGPDNMAHEYVTVQYPAGCTENGTIVNFAFGESPV